jgi:ankyrin repeat protein
MHLKMIALVSLFALVPLGAVAFEESAAVYPRVAGSETRHRSLPEQIAAVGNPLWSDTLPVLPSLAADLIAACRTGDAEQVKRLLNAGALANGNDATGERPLVAAVAAGSAESVRLLLQRGASPDVKGAIGLTPLGMAAAEGRNDLVGILLRGGARPDLAGDNRGTPLHEAVRYDHAPVVATLLKSDPVIARYDREGMHPLALAAARGSHGSLEALLAAGADPDLPDSKGLTALYWARRFERPLAEEMLLRHGAVREAWPLHVD